MAMAVSCQGSGRPSTCPPWLQVALADIEQRVHSLALSLPEDPTSDSFADRAENYYQKRPQLLSLLQDLHNRYLHLADRYSQSLLKLTSSSSSAAAHTELSDDDDRPPLSTISTFSDADSSLSLSFHPDPSSFPFSASIDPIIVELTMSLVEKNILVEELSISDRRQSDSVRKIELQGSLLELMESERVVLVAENARLAYRATAAEEEGRGLAAEVGYMRRKAVELAKCVGRMREERRVCVLGQRIDGLRRQVAGLERREREWREVAARRGRERGDVREEVERLREENRRLRRKRGKRGGWVRGWWWGCAGGGGGGGGARGKKGGKAGAKGGPGCFWENPCFCL